MRLIKNVMLQILDKNNDFKRNTRYGIRNLSYTNH